MDEGCTNAVISEITAPANILFSGFDTKTEKGTISLDMPLEPMNGARGFLIAAVSHDKLTKRHMYISREAMAALVRMYMNFSQEDREY